MRALTAVVAALVALCWAGAASASTCNYLEMRLMQLQSGSATGAAISELQRQVVASGCRGARTPGQPWDWEDAEAAPQGPFGQPTVVQPHPQSRQPRGTFTTVCVRSCDGYFFPISFSTTRKHFEADEATCRNRCPAGDAYLYYHSRGAGPDGMLSLAEEPYSALENAFRYKTAFDPRCDCGAPLLLDTVGEYPALGLARLPRPRPEPGQDPETALNRLGQLSLPALSGHTEPRLAEQPMERPATVRIILPSWDPTAMDAVLLTIPPRYSPGASQHEPPGESSEVEIATE